MEPPIHTEYFLSGGAITLTFIDCGARLFNSLPIRSAIPEYDVDTCNRNRILATVTATVRDLYKISQMILFYSYSAYITQ